jgi:hypothetical protein
VRINSNTHVGPVSAISYYVRTRFTNCVTDGVTVQCYCCVTVQGTGSAGSDVERVGKKRRKICRII